MILLIDNFDSFVDNVARYLRRLGMETEIVRNDAVTVDQIATWNPSAIVISPGPCTPEDAGQTKEIIDNFAGRIPILGICLGHQAIGSVYGAKIIRAIEPFHGRQSTLAHSGHPIFRDVPERFEAGRYHSLVIDQNTLSSNFDINCTSADRTIMGIADDRLALFGLQFHPESILTPHGFTILRNFLSIAGLMDTADHHDGLFHSESFSGLTHVPGRQDSHEHASGPISSSTIEEPKARFQNESHAPKEYRR